MNQTNPQFPVSSRPVRFGILSVGTIATAFASEAKSSPHLELLSVASRDRSRTAAFAKAHGIARVADSYAALLEDPDVEVVYIGLPNSLHTEWCLRALKAGKHVLCEKPLTGSWVDARTIYATARKAGLHVGEAYPYRAQPQTIEMLRIIGSGEIGRPLAIQASFCFKLTNPDDIRFDPALAGGALMDAGAYPISLVRSISGAMPVYVQAAAIIGDRGVDTALVANLAFEGGLMAQISCGFNAASHRFAVIACEDGVIEANYANGTLGNVPTSLRVKRPAKQGIPSFETLQFPAVDALRAEAESFAEQVRTGRPWVGASEQESIDIAAILEQVGNVAQVVR